MKRFADSVARQKGIKPPAGTRNRDPSAVHSSTGTRPRKPAVNRSERPAPNRQVRRRYRSPKRLRGRRGSSFPTKPRPVRLPCPHGLHQTWARSAARAVARLPMPTSRRDQRRLNRQRQRGGHGNARQMPVAVQQRLLARVRDQDESLGIVIGAFAINPVLRRSCAWPSIRGSWQPASAPSSQFLVLKRHVGQVVSKGGRRCFLRQSAHASG
jgi:hypothetical protein